MKQLLTLTLLLASFAASAGLNSDSASSAGFNQLTEAQKAEVIKVIAQQAESNKNSSTSVSIPDPEGIERWTKIGTSIASGLGAAAKELNVGVNEFAKSPVGQLTTVLIIWKIIGTQLMHIIGAILIWILGIVTIKIAADRLEPEDIEYSTTDKNIFGNFIIVKRHRDSMSGDAIFGLLVASAVLISLGIGVLFSGS